jgi:hypothetical protein
MIHSENKALQEKLHRLEQANSKLQGSLRGGKDHNLARSIDQPLIEPRIVGRADNDSSRKRLIPFGEDGVGDEDPQSVLALIDHCLTMSNYGRSKDRSKISSS